MVKHLFLIIFTLFILWSCCDPPVETARYELTPYEKQLIPYYKNQKIDFIHSNGYTLKFNITDERTEWLEHHPFCEWNCCGKEFYSFQVRSVTMKSEYPHININLDIGSKRDYNPENNIFILTINNRIYTEIDYDTKGNFINIDDDNLKKYNSLLIGNVIYHDVYEKFFSNSNTGSLEYSSFLYNSEGLLQIKMNDNETYTIKN